MRKKRALVLGASMAGLGAASALAKHYERVTVIDRDALADVSDETESRKGVPQGNHGHALLAAGYRLLDEQFPTLLEDLRGRAFFCDAGGEFLWHGFGQWKVRAHIGIEVMLLPRPVLERGVRRCVRALPNIDFLERHHAEAPLYDATRGRITGVRVRDLESGTTSLLSADLVVDATGRGSHAPAWLAEWGFGDVPTVESKIDLGYASALFERRPGDCRGAMGAVLSSHPAQSTRGGAMFATYGDRWTVTLGGMMRDWPGTDLYGFRDFTRRLPSTEIYDVIRDREPLTPIYPFRYPMGRWRRFAALKRLPDGFLVIGDALCSFNPLYGQGMTVAMQQAKVLGECLTQGPDGLARRYFTRVDAIAATPWSLVAGEERQYMGVADTTLASSLLARYGESVHLAASEDPQVLRRFTEVAHLLAPPRSLFSPRMLWRVLMRRLARPRQVRMPSLMPGPA